MLEQAWLEGATLLPALRVRITAEQARERLAHGRVRRERAVEERRLEQPVVVPEIEVTSDVSLAAAGPEMLERERRVGGEAILCPLGVVGNLPADREARRLPQPNE